MCGSNGLIFYFIYLRYTKLPVILKGILTKEDALLAVETGCRGIIVSNHGARQLDTVAASVSFNALIEQSFFTNLLY